MAAAPEDNQPSAEVRKLSLTSYLPSLKVLSWGLSLSCLALFFIFPLGGFNQSSWSSGPVSSNHSIIGDNCNVCHATPFSAVKDESCTACHKVTDHESSPHAQPSQSQPLQRCAECHFEHRDKVGMIAHESKLCTECHATALKHGDSEMMTLAVNALSGHPEFRVAVGDAQVSLDDKAKLKDDATLKLNHKIHLKPNLESRDSQVTLTCVSCHELAPNYRDIQPISFERHCQNCHSLGFDERLSNIEVPHADPDVVFDSLYAAYAKFSWQGGGGGATQANTRSRPGVEQNPVNLQLTPQQVASESRDAEKLLFEKTACQLCHEVRPKEASDYSSRYEVVKPKVKEHWYTAAVFSHGAHEEVACVSCHTDVTKSEATHDVLLPGVNNCRECHADPGAADHVPSDCITCHSYHDSLSLDLDKKSEIETILKGIRN